MTATTTGLLAAAFQEVGFDIVPFGYYPPFQALRQILSLALLCGLGLYLTGRRNPVGVVLLTVALAVPLLLAKGVPYWSIPAFYVSETYDGALI
jgi:hypothetical protein